jgi:small subunit ribosomal protein S2
MVDTNSDPSDIDFVIPANDDAAKSITLVIELMTQAIAEGLNERKAEKDKDGAQSEREPAPEGGRRSRFKAADYEEEQPVKAEEAVAAEVEKAEVADEETATEEE